MEEFEHREVLLPARAEFTNIQEMAFLQLVALSRNLALFLAIQIEFMILTMTDLTTILHWGDHDLSQRFQMSSIL
jgi:predicted ATPase